MLSQPGLQKFDCREEVVTQGNQQIDVVEVLTTTEAVSQIIPGVDGRSEFAAGRAEEAEVAVRLLGGRPLSAQAQGSENEE
jgi:hypothetical protein